jgi:hypothetical protein
VQVLDEAIEAAVNLSARYIPARQLPDKSVSVLDTACARVAVSQHAVPAEVDDSRRRIEALTTELEIIDRDETAGYDVADRREAVTAAKEAEEAREAELNARWEAEKAVVEEILACARKLREGGARSTMAAPSPRRRAAPASRPDDRAAPDGKLRAKNAELQALQGETPLILPIVDAQAVGGRRRLDRHPRGPDAARRDRDGARPRQASGQARDRPGPRDEDDRQAHPDQPRRARQPVETDRGLPARRHLGRRQDRDGAGAGRGALWRRTERHHHQHERVSGGAYRLDA